ncbi:MAG: 2-oxoacid:acceptor oxidoreductase subunit alpha [Acidobacteria bacterium]|nr:2-oxoacid:acceptor oxidoreductase subunit alpha [Acidobacteriota bacterium]
MSKTVERTLLENAIVRFSGDSGDGMQLTGTQFTTTSANLGNDIATFPDFPAEIRAPAGTVPGVSGFQIHFSSRDIHTPGDRPSVLIAMNPAALKANIDDLENGGLLIVNSDAFSKANLKKADYETNPLEDGSVERYRVIKIPITELTHRAVEETGLAKKEADRCKNFYALGIVYYLFDRNMNLTLDWINRKFAKRPEIAAANRLALIAGNSYADTTEIFTTAYSVPPASLTKGKYRSITGNQATAIGFAAAAKLAKRTLFYGSYPITPASDVLHELAALRHFDIQTFQAEDEIAAVCAAIGAAFAGSLALTGTSGPGVCLKSEAINLAIMTELPLVILNVQRAGPSTGMPTKTEQSDLLQAMFGRNGDSPVVILAPATPAECFTYAIESIRIATKYMVPVFILSDGYLANGAEPWRIPDENDLPHIPVSNVAAHSEFLPFERNPETLARGWAVPGTAGLEHRIGGLEKSDGKGNISYDPDNHERMTHYRKEKVARIAHDVPPLEVYGDETADTLILGWGGTYGSIFTAVEWLNQHGVKLAGAHFRYLNPFPANTQDIMRQYKRVIVAEINTGQLDWLIKGQFNIPTTPYQQVRGKPLLVSDLCEFIQGLK